MSKLNKLFWHIISMAICAFYRNECSAANFNYISSKRYCCAPTTELVYLLYKTPNDSEWKYHCSRPGFNNAEYMRAGTIARPSEPIIWNADETLKTDGNFFAEIYNDHHYYLNSCIEHNTNKTLYNDDSSNFIDQCNLNKLYIHECPYNGSVATPITIIKGKKSNDEHYICTTANLTNDNVPSENLKLYRQFYICSACDGINNNTPSITSCYQPATTENTLYENKYGYFELKSDCRAK